jgi:hypothetical protein
MAVAPSIKKRSFLTQRKAVFWCTRCTRLQYSAPVWGGSDMNIPSSFTGAGKPSTGGADVWILRQETARMFAEVVRNALNRAVKDSFQMTLMERIQAWKQAGRAII